MRSTVTAGMVRMRALAADLPNGLSAGYRAGRELALANGPAGARVYAVGMGGSAIAADLVRGVVDAESGLAFDVVRSDELPGAIDASTRVLILSYSGETAETVGAYAAAGRAGARRAVLTSGGTLADRAEEDGVPVVRVPPGLPPRAAIGHLFGGILGLLDPVFPESNEGRVARIAERLRPEIGRYARDGGPADEIARAIGDRVPYLCAESRFFPLARRWATQIEENAKRLAAFDEAPELFHNSVVAWAGLRRAEAARYAVLLFEWSEQEPMVRRGFAELARVLAERAVRTIRVPLASDDRLEAIVRGIALGDQVSLRLAERGGVDPSAVAAIDRMRSALAGVGVPVPGAAERSRRRVPPAVRRRRAASANPGPRRTSK